MKKLTAIAIGITMLITACKKENTPLFDSQAKGTLSVEFDNIAGGANLQLNTGIYTNAVGETFNVSKLKYYVSNFIFTNTDGTEYVVPQDSAYFLIEEGITDDVSFKVPEGEYKTLTFTLGVDSLRNTMDISRRTGVLDPATTAADMYWGWNSGYIFLKFEGTSRAVNSATHVFMYHSGGFGGYSSPMPNNVKTIVLDLSARGVARVTRNKPSNIHLMADLLKILGGKSNLSFATTSMIHSPGAGVVLANNYQFMFRHDHTEN